MSEQNSAPDNGQTPVVDRMARIRALNCAWNVLRENDWRAEQFLKDTSGGTAAEVADAVAEYSKIMERLVAEKAVLVEQLADEALKKNPLKE